MIARIAEQCFWLGRYLERTESTARVLQVTGQLALDAALPPEACWGPVLAVFGEREAFTARHGEARAVEGEAVQAFMTWEEGSASSLLRAVATTRENARSMREVVSRECWEVINELHLWLGSPAARAEYEAHRYDFYQQVRRMVQLCLGLVRSTMLHDTPLDFIWLGVMLERVGQTARLLDVHHHAFGRLPEGHQVVETALWLTLLKACSGFEPFMKLHSGRVTGDAVAAFLLFEPRFPRSVRYCLASAHRYLKQLSPSEQAGLPGRASLARSGPLLAMLRPESLEVPEATVHELLTYVVDETAALCDTLAAEYFGLQRAAASAR